MPSALGESLFVVPFPAAFVLRIVFLGVKINLLCNNMHKDKNPLFSKELNAGYVIKRGEKNNPALNRLSLPSEV